MLTETMANTTIKLGLLATQKQITIAKSANAVGWAIAIMYIFGPAPRESTSQECRIARELNCLNSLTYQNNYGKNKY